VAYLLLVRQFPSDFTEAKTAKESGLNLLPSFGCDFSAHTLWTIVLTFARMYNSNFGSNDNAIQPHSFVANFEDARRAPQDR